ncbi:TrkH family potassium uptake protein [Xanthovirga aplysinae]|uniref:TrkH family potassium uptake protein n=1 Tax=Xanthovirga aplysinae TaxID=2529853 RepID=UPI0012BCC65E|nr:TrkH family potassium uptake protein [Xanthovirga aplysinae]MTI32964.1 TrkH family potassium uptake protein [Xanthovirga aplysinae]
MRIHLKVIAHILGLLNALNGLFMLLCLPFSIYYKEESWKEILLAGLITVVAGFAIWFFTRDAKNQEVSKKDGYLIVTLGWLSISCFGTLPYLLTGAIPTFTDAFFETMSGYTTTGASILNDIESLHKGILFWRSLTQWIGGMGIIVLAVAILPILGIGGMQLFVAEAPGISPDKLQPRIRDTATRLWFVYVGLTMLEFLLLLAGKMTFFDAINHSLTTMATGGFSTKQDSAALFSPYIQYVMIVFMFLAGTSFTLSYFAIKLNFKKILKNEEFKVYLSFTVVITFIITLILYHTENHPFEKAFRDTLFQVVSVLTTTGYVSSDYSQWAPMASLIIFTLMFIGGSAGSTAGGVKVVRHVILIKNSLLELKRQLHPAAVIPVRLNHKAVTQPIAYNVLAFIMIYLIIFTTGSVALSLLEVDFMTSIGAVATSLGNIGPGFGSVGPVDNFSHIPTVGKWILSILMMLGRLELFTVLILFTPYYWSKY